MTIVTNNVIWYMTNNSLTVASIDGGFNVVAVNNEEGRGVLFPVIRDVVCNNDRH